MRFYFKLDSENSIIEKNVSDISLGNNGYVEVTKEVYVESNSYKKFNPETFTLYDPIIPDEEETNEEYETIKASIEELKNAQLTTLEVILEVYSGMMALTE